MQREVIAEQRLANQRITQTRQHDPAKLVAWLGAVQAQEFGPAKWGLGLRLPPGSTDGKIQRAIDAGRILRTHVLRPTWHFVTPRDIRWMLELSAASVHRRMATYDRQLDLDASIFNRAAKVCERVLEGGNYLTRRELSEHFARAGLPAQGYRVGHVMLYIELEGVVCSGPRRGGGKQSTYALLAERAPHALRLSREEALGELARRYFRSHGPATLRDFVWWSGLSTPDAKRGLEIVRPRELKIDGKSYWTLGASAVRTHRQVASLLPVYDEYLVAYRDRDAVPHGPAMIRSRVGGYMRFQHSLVIEGQVAGTWRATARGDSVVVDLATLRPLADAETRAVRRELKRYQRFVGVPVSLSGTEKRARA